jgi:sugar phosphate isomerase/epimerase
MIRSAVTVSLVPEVRGGPFVYWDDLPAACKKAKALGFDAIEIFPPGPDVIDPADLRKLLDDNDLALAAVGTGAGWVKYKMTLCHPDPSIRETARMYVRSIIDLAGPFGASAIIGSMQGRHDAVVDAATAQTHLCEALNDLGEHALQHRVPLLFEPLNRYETNQANTLADGVKLLASLSTKNVRLLADLFHMNIEEPDIAGSIRAAGQAIGHVHFVDSNRRAAGMGHLDFAPIAASLRDVGYDRYLSAEALALPEPDSAAKQTIETFRRWFR